MVKPLIRCGVCLRGPRIDVGMFQVLDCCHPVCGSCLANLEGFYQCQYPGCHQFGQIGPKVQPLTLAEIEWNEYLENLELEKCPQHVGWRKSVVCLPPYWEGGGRPECPRCVADLNSSPAEGSVVEIKELLVEITPREHQNEALWTEIIANLAKIGLFIRSERALVIFLQRLRLQALHFDYESLTADSSDWKIRKEGDTTKIFCSKLEKIERILENVSKIISKFVSTNQVFIDNLNQCLGQLLPLTQIELKAERVEFPHICDSKTDPGQPLGKVSCCFCDPRAKKARAIRWLADQIDIFQEKMDAPEATVGLTVKKSGEVSLRDVGYIINEVEEFWKMEIENRKKVETTRELTEIYLADITAKSEILNKNFVRLFAETTALREENRIFRDLFSKLAKGEALNPFTDIPVSSLTVSANPFFEIPRQSKLVTIQDMAFFMKLLPDLRRATLVYATHIHGISVREFHARCDHLAPTLVIIKVNQYVAGGYSDVNWRPANGHTTESNFKRSERSFLFSVNRQKKYPILPYMASKAVFCDGNLGPTFGEGSDISVHFNIKDGTSHSFLGNCYSTEGSPNADQELFGSRYFSIDEYEVFHLE